MSFRYLFGPLPRDFALTNLQPLMDTGTLVPFSLVPREPSVRIIDWNDTWDTLLARCPTEFQPDFVAVPIAYQAIPTWLYRAPVPLVGMAADWSLLFHQYRLQLPWLDAVLTDQPGVEVFSRLGMKHVYPANLYGLDPAFPLADPDDDSPRPYDVAFIGNFHSCVQGARLPWLARLASLADKYRILLATGVPRAEYPLLLRQAKIAFNYAQRRECNLRVFEAAGAGCLLFQEADCLEVADYFTDRQECVRYHPHDLLALLDHYLTHDDERRAVARAARMKVTEFTYPALWQRGLDTLRTDWDAIQQRATERFARIEPPSLALRVWCQAGAMLPDPTLVAEVNRSLEQHPDDATLHHLAAIAHSQSSPNELPLDAVGTHLVASLQRQPDHPLRLAHLSFLLSASDHHDAAEQLALRTLRLLDDPAREGSSLLRETPLFPPGFDVLRVEWERAAWSHAGDERGESAAKRTLLRWWLHALRGQRSGHVTPWFEAVLARPDLPLSQASLGCALARKNIFFEAVGHLRQAVQSNPFDNDAARAYCQVLRDVGDTVSADELVQARRRLHTIAPGLVPPQEWFMAEPSPPPPQPATPAPVVIPAPATRPSGKELASIIILCCNEAGLTRRCLESVRRHTRAPYELILVDNGSTDGTQGFLAEVSRWLEPARVRIVRNATNRGYSAGCNQGLREAHGRYLVLLNNDTIVTPAWLDRLVDWSLHEWPAVGMVGPVSNYAPPPQLVEPGYDTLEQLEAFAAQRRHQFAAKAVRTERLTGFCLLLRREVVDQIGFLDERFGPGFFEDDDLCMRAREAGFGMLVALEVYIHHFGSRTFAALGIDAQAQLHSNWQQFLHKWGPAKTAGYRPPPSREAERGTKARVSLTMIVRNEENNIRDCLASVQGLVDEIIVVDTGSEDRTREIAVEMGAKVFEFLWVDNFAAARNEALKQATGDWIFWLDADDRVDPTNRERLRALFASLPATQQVAFSMKCSCLPDPQARSATVVDHVRLFRRDPAIRWVFRVHEQILPSIRNLGGDVIEADVIITHTGYQDPALRRRKLDRDLRLLRMELEDHPEHPFALFNLGSVLHELGQVAPALDLFQRSLARSKRGDSIERKLYANIVQCRRQLNQPQEALAVCSQGLQRCPDDPELLWLQANLHEQNKSWSMAESSLLRLIAGPPRGYFASVVEGLHTYRARTLLAQVYLKQKRYAEAESNWREVLRERPDWVEAWHGLANLCLEQKRLDEMLGHVQQLEQLGYPIPAQALRVKRLIELGQFAAAKAMAEQMTRDFPQDTAGWELLSDVLMVQQDVMGQEAALQQVLLRDARHHAALTNLSFIVLQRLRSQDAVFAVDEIHEWLRKTHYENACHTPSEWQQCLPVLRDLASRSKHITQIGTGEGIGTLALLAAQPLRLVSYDGQPHPSLTRLEPLHGRTDWALVQTELAAVEIEETDLLLIDIGNNAELIQKVLDKNRTRVRDYLIVRGLSAEQAGAMQWSNLLRRTYGAGTGLTVWQREGGER